MIKHRQMRILVTAKKAGYILTDCIGLSASYTQLYNMMITGN